MEIIKQIKEELKKNADESYRKFSASLIPNCKNIIGVRLPVLRKLAKKLEKQDIQEFLSAKTDILEEKILKGMLIGRIAKDADKKTLKLITNFVPEIDNWSVCDSFCCSLKFISSNKERIWEFIQGYVRSKKEFEIRFALVIILDWYIEESYLSEIYSILDGFKSESYYAIMAAAWLLSICFIKYPDKTFEYLKKSKLDDDTFNKALQKITDSYRVDSDTKILIKSLKRKPKL